MGSTTNSNMYDFIVVGAGPAGSSVAATLSKSPKKPSVLLVEAGGDNGDPNLRVDGQRYTTFATHADMNWGYKTTPQENCAGREIDYSRGRGLGGSSAVNFGLFNVGARDDYDEWARLVGDDSFSWSKMQPRLRKLESFEPKVPSNVSDPSKYVNVRGSDHGSSGPLKVGYAAEWEDDLTPLIDAFESAGWPRNPDHNSGDPMGISVAINSARNGIRSTANDLLTPQPENLTIVLSSPVDRLILSPTEKNKVIGIETSSGAKYHASKEVILSAGSLDGPKILMHTGIGPKDQLDQFSIPCVADIPSIGQGLRDHMFTPLLYTKEVPSKGGKTNRGDYYSSPSLISSALDEWKKSGTGPMAKYGCQGAIGWRKLPNLSSTQEFKSLPPQEQEFLSKPTVPHYEIFTHVPMHQLIPGYPTEDPVALNYSAVLCFYYNAQARGTVTLQSSDPKVPLLFDPKLLGTEFDRRLAIEALRDTLAAVREGTKYAEDTTGVITGPKSESDEDLLEYWKQTISSSWHMTGTIKMGDESEKDTAPVDKEFKLRGFEGLRVADMSVVPVLASCHIQGVAYLTGLTCGEKLVEEYGLA